MAKQRKGFKSNNDVRVQQYEYCSLCKQSHVVLTLAYKSDKEPMYVLYKVHVSKATYLHLPNI